MTEHICNGASLQCTLGLAPATLVVLPASRVNSSKQPAATIMDFREITNITPFGMCTSPANPAVAAATAAALGVLTPMPCIPMTVAPWTPGCPTVTLGHVPALDSTSQLMCAWGGVITVISPGQMTHRIP